MAKHASHILDLARKGAEHKYDELKAEIAALVTQFPHLAARAGAAMSKRGNAAVAAVTGSAPRKRQKLSAKARKAMSDAQKARWAKVKAGKKG
jgi:hypothetical protein